MTVDRSEFNKLQYETLRTEIRDTKSRIFKIIGMGLIVIPASQYLVRLVEMDALLLGLPFTILIVAILYLSENHGLMRCGRYIRAHIESTVDGVGWEEWLESKDACEPRTVDRFVNYCFYILFLIYYVLSSVLSVRYAGTFGQMWLGIAIGFYLAMGAVIGVYLAKAAKLTTSTKLDDYTPFPPPQPTSSVTNIPLAPAGKATSRKSAEDEEEQVNA